MLLTACREIITNNVPPPYKSLFIPTFNLILALTQRDEEPWATYSHGKPISPEGLAELLRQYGIRSTKNKAQTYRGYTANQFEASWRRYLSPAVHSVPTPVPPLKTPANPPIPPTPKSSKPKSSISKS